jgi:hypothetical protein
LGRVNDSPQRLKPRFDFAAAMARLEAAPFQNQINPEPFQAKANPEFSVACCTVGLHSDAASRL